MLFPICFHMMFIVFFPIFPRFSRGFPPTPTPQATKCPGGRRCRAPPPPLGRPGGRRLLHPANDGKWPMKIDGLPIENGDVPWLC